MLKKMTLNRAKKLICFILLVPSFCWVTCFVSASKSSIESSYKLLRSFSTRREGRHSYLTLRTAELEAKFPQLLSAIVSNAKY